MTAHGLAQSQALTAAAQNLSRAKAYLTDLREYKPRGYDETSMRYRERILLGEQRLHTAQVAYDAAYLAYTNPFRVTKTV